MNYVLEISVAAIAALGITALLTGHDGVAAAAAAGGILTIAGYAVGQKKQSQDVTPTSR